MIGMKKLPLKKEKGGQQTTQEILPKNCKYDILVKNCHFAINR